MAAPALDPRLLQVTIEVNGRLKTYSDIAITATGTKYANSLMNECDVTLCNLTRADQDFILSETSPYNRNRTPKSVHVQAGRKSYGLSTIFRGNIAYATVGQPPDIVITLKCVTGQYLNGTVLSNSYAGATSLSAVSAQLAQQANLALTFTATDKIISNYAYSGSLIKQIGHVESIGGVNIFVDDNNLVVANLGTGLTGIVRILNADSGMIGIPTLDQNGLKVKFLLDNTTRLGGILHVTSAIYPAINGRYFIHKLSFDIANRDTPFYYIAECTRPFI